MTAPVPSAAAFLPPFKRALILGGARSGKSARAEALVRSAAGDGIAVYLATSEAGDGEMAARIAQHRARRGPRWITREAPLDLVGAIAGEARPVLIDCLTLWLSNLMHAGRDVAREAEGLAAAIERHASPIVLVSNEVGMGIVPDNALAREFRDHAGRLHQHVAAVADRVELVVAGLPLVLKPQGTL